MNTYHIERDNCHFGCRIARIFPLFPAAPILHLISVHCR